MCLFFLHRWAASVSEIFAGRRRRGKETRSRPDTPTGRSPSFATDRPRRVHTRSVSSNAFPQSVSVPPRPAAVLIVTRCGVSTGATRQCRVPYFRVSPRRFARTTTPGAPNTSIAAAFSRALPRPHGIVLDDTFSPSRGRSFGRPTSGTPRARPPPANSTSTTSRRLRNTCSVIIVLFLIDFRTAVVHVVRRVRFLSYTPRHDFTCQLAFFSSVIPASPSCLYVLFLIPDRVCRRNLLALLAQGNQKYEYELMCNIVEKSKNEFIFIVRQPR